MANSAMPAVHAATSPATVLNERFAGIYTDYQARITGLVRTQVRGNDRDLADDLTADAFMHAWLSLHQCKATTEQQMFAWLATIARRTVCQHYRVARNTREIPADTGDWQYANRNLSPAASGAYQVVNTGFRTAKINGPAAGGGTR